MPRKASRVPSHIDARVYRDLTVTFRNWQFAAGQPGGASNFIDNLLRKEREAYDRSVHRDELRRANVRIAELEAMINAMGGSTT